MKKESKTRHESNLEEYIKLLKANGNTTSIGRDKEEDYPELKEMFPNLTWRLTYEWDCRYLPDKRKPYYILEVKNGN